MAKAIRFNLILDGYPARTLEDVREHFSLEDIMQHFQSGILRKWLDVRGFQKEAESLDSIPLDADPASSAAELVRIFDVPVAPEDLEMAVAVLGYLDEEKALARAYEKNAFARSEIIADYHKGYEDLLSHMESVGDNWPLLLADAIQLERAYGQLFALNPREVYRRLQRTAPKAVFAILARDGLRDGWLQDEEIATHLELWPSRRPFSCILGNDLHIVNRDTQAMWDPVVSAGKKVMVLSVSEGAFVKNSGVFGEKLGADDMNGQFIRCNGLDYQCNDEKLNLAFVEL